MPSTQRRRSIACWNQKRPQNHNCFPLRPGSFAQNSSHDWVFGVKKPCMKTAYVMKPYKPPHKYGKGVHAEEKRQSNCMEVHKGLGFIPGWKSYSSGCPLVAQKTIPTTPRKRRTKPETTCRPRTRLDKMYDPQNQGHSCKRSQSPYPVCIFRMDFSVGSFPFTLFRALLRVRLFGCSLQRSKFTSLRVCRYHPDNWFLASGTHYRNMTMHRKYCAQSDHSPYPDGMNWFLMFLSLGHGIERRFTQRMPNQSS